MVRIFWPYRRAWYYYAPLLKHPFWLNTVVCSHGRFHKSHGDFQVLLKEFGPKHVKYKINIIYKTRHTRSSSYPNWSWNWAKNCRIRASLGSTISIFKLSSLTCCIVMPYRDALYRRWPTITTRVTEEPRD